MTSVLKDSDELIQACVRLLCWNNLISQAWLPSTASTSIYNTQLGQTILILKNCPQLIQTLRFVIL